MNRRSFIKQAAVASAAVANTAIWAGKAQADQSARAYTGHKQAGYYWLKIGEYDVAALSDGTLNSNGRILNGQPGQVEKLLEESHAPTPRVTSVNSFLILMGERRILVDAGTGQLLGPTLDKLPTSLESAGFAAEQITDILLTHIHADHSGGLTAGGKRVFPNATVHVNDVEADFWLSPVNQDKATDKRKWSFVQADKALAPYVSAGKVSRFKGGNMVLPGISSINAPGHTPGHTFFALESRGEKLVFFGDTVHVGEVQFPSPELAIEYDIDPDGAVEQRRKAFAEASEEGYLVAGAHISFPGIGHVAKAATGYRWIPIPYVNDSHA